MPLLNYTTVVPASRSIAEICEMLQLGGAHKVMMENGHDREIIAVSFTLQTTWGRVAYQLPANVPAVIVTINAQINEETRKVNRGRGYKRKIPARLLNDKEQAERIAWRIAKDWLEAQLALEQIGGAKLEQIMMPFAITDGKTFYQRMIERGTLALPAPENSEPLNVTPV
jgi:hypothetical protein